MIYFLLILFFGSLFGIIFMIGKKLSIVQNGQIIYKDEAILEGPYIEEVKHAIAKNFKKYSFVVLVVMVRLYVYISNFLVKKYQQIKTKMINLRGKKLDVTETGKKEPNAFLKVVSEYKHKIRNIRRQIKEEEEI